MTNQAQRRIVIVNRSAMLDSPLFRAMDFLNSNASDKVASFASTAFNHYVERRDYEATQDRVIDGLKQTGQSPDIKHLRSLAESHDFHLLGCALNLDTRALFFPQSQDGGKSASETSSLKAYKKFREVAECIWSGNKSLENVVKVWTVCAFMSSRDFDQTVLPRNVSELFLNASRIVRGTSELFDALDDYRAKHMTTGASTQTSQMVRTLVALKSASDVRDGRHKHTAINVDGLVLDAIMRRFGVVSGEHTDDVRDASTVDASDWIADAVDAPLTSVDETSETSETASLADLLALVDDADAVPVYTVEACDDAHADMVASLAGTDVDMTDGDVTVEPEPFDASDVAPVKTKRARKSRK